MDSGENTNKSHNSNEYEIIYVNICSKETVDYINCVHSETYGVKCNKNKLLKLFLDCHHGKNKQDEKLNYLK